jgi:hypothetical protein
LAAVELVDASSKQDGTGAVVEIPLDFRMVGIAELDTRGVSKEVQGNIFNHFMSKYTKPEREAYIAQYEAVKSNPEQLEAWMAGVIQAMGSA